MPACPICQSTSFGAYDVRKNALCNECGALERTRYLWAYLNWRGLPTPGSRVLHVAPEKCLTERLSSAIGAGYKPVDFEPERYTTDSITVTKFDMCSDTKEIETDSLDAVIHLHVLEHLPCALDYVLAETMRVLRPQGYFIFAIPFAAGITIENLWPDLTDEERIEVFGQRDHLRRIGNRDFPRFLARVMQPYTRQKEFRVDPGATLGRDRMEEIAVPFDRANSLTGDALFDIVKGASADREEQCSAK